MSNRLYARECSEEAARIIRKYCIVKFGSVSTGILFAMEKVMHQAKVGTLYEDLMAERDRVAEELENQRSGKSRPSGPQKEED